MKKLQLTRPIAFFDIESTSIDTQKARITELGIIRLYPDGSTDSMCMIFNPEENISEENSAIHGFTNEMVKDKPLFKDMAPEVKHILHDCDFGTFNGNSYDIPLLAAEFARANVPFRIDGREFIDVGNLFKILNSRTLTAAVATYLGKDHAGAHGAIPDTQATIDVLNAMLDKHGDDLPATVPELALKSNYGRKRLDLDGKFVYNSLGVAVFTFGKHKDQPVANTPKTYLQWMLDAKGDDGKHTFSYDTRNIIGLFLQGIGATDKSFASNARPSQGGKF